MDDFSQNIILNAFCLVCSLIGTYYVDRWGRKPITLLSQASLTVFLFMVGALTKVYGTSNNTSGVYGTVACIFLFQGAYSFGWTPILYLYPPEVLNFPIRANGMGVFQVFLNGAALLMLFTMPIAIANIGWKTYMINGAWDIVVTIIIAYWWVETKGKTLEEVDAAINGHKRGDGPQLDAVRRGEVDVDVEALKAEANAVSESHGHGGAGKGDSDSEEAEKS